MLISIAYVLLLMFFYVPLIKPVVKIYCLCLVSVSITYAFHCAIDFMCHVIETVKRAAHASFARGSWSFLRHCANIFASSCMYIADRSFRESDRSEQVKTRAT